MSVCVCVCARVCACVCVYVFVFVCVCVVCVGCVVGGGGENIKKLCGSEVHIYVQCAAVISVAMAITPPTLFFHLRYAFL